jgi:heme-degrading monooxygenase HmoA
MSVRILIKRKVPKEKEADLLVLTTQLRALASREPGYISGETLKRLDKPDEFLVISTWQDADDWNKWKASKERSEIQKKIDILLGKATQYEMYHYPKKVRVAEDVLGY